MANINGRAARIEIRDVTSGEWIPLPPVAELRVLDVTDIDMTPPRLEVQEFRGRFDFETYRIAPYDCDDRVEG